MQIDHQISARRLNLVLFNKKKRNHHLEYFPVIVDHRVKIKENKKIGKYLNLARELKKLFNMKVMVVPIEVGALGAVLKGLLRRLKKLEFRWRIKTIQIIGLLRLF